MLLPTGVPASVCWGCHPPRSLQTPHFCWVLHPQAPSFLARFSGTFLHPRGFASTSSYTSGILSAWGDLFSAPPGLSLFPSLSFSSCSASSWLLLLGFSPFLISSAGSPFTLRIGFASFLLFPSSLYYLPVSGPRKPAAASVIRPEMGLPPDPRGPLPHPRGSRWHLNQTQVGGRCALSRPK